MLQASNQKHKAPISRCAISIVCNSHPAQVVFLKSQGVANCQITLVADCVALRSSGICLLDQFKAGKSSFQTFLSLHSLLHSQHVQRTAQIAVQKVSRCKTVQGITLKCCRYGRTLHVTPLQESLTHREARVKTSMTSSSQMGTFIRCECVSLLVTSLGLSFEMKPGDTAKAVPSELCALGCAVEAIQLLLCSQSCTKDLTPPAQVSRLQKGANPLSVLLSFVPSKITSRTLVLDPPG